VGLVSRDLVATLPSDLATRLDALLNETGR
jgi:hypothetical protein